MKYQNHSFPHLKCIVDCANRFVALLVFLSLVCQARAATVTIDARAVFQRMEGFGTSSRVFDDPHVYENFNPTTQRAATVLTTAQQDEVLDRLYVELGLTRVHPVNPDVGTLEGQPYIGVEPTNDNADPNVTDLSKFDFSWKNLDAHVIDISRARQRGVTTYFLSPLNRQTWMGTTTANDAAEYAEWLLAMVLRAQTLGVTLPYLSVANEPSYSRNTMSGAFIRDVIKNLGPRLRAAGLPTLFVVPDDVRSSDAAAKTQTIMADPVARSYVGALATHLYDESITNVFKMKALSQQYGLPLWMTETSLGLAGSFGFGSGPFDWADLIHQLISTYDVTAIDYQWGFIGAAGGNGSFITLNPDPGTQAYTGYTLRKEYYVTGQYSRWVRPGARRIQCVSDDPNVKVTAYVDGSSLTIVAVNNTAGNLSATFNLTGLPAITTLNSVRTSASENWASLAAVNVIGSAFTAGLGHRSVTTFTSGLPAQDPAADDFQRASLGPNWTRYTANAEIVNGADVGVPAPSTTSLFYIGWTASTFDADQFSEAIVANGRPDTMFLQMWVRRRASDLARYAFHFNDENPDGTGIANPRWEIKYDGVPSAQTRILASVPAAAMPQPGDTLRIEARGTSPVIIKGFLNGVEVITATDSAPQRIMTSGPAGLVSRVRRGGYTAPTNSPLFASWRGGSLGPALAIERVSLIATNLTLRFATVTNKSYAVQCTDRLTPPSWNILTTVAGDGTQKSVAITNAAQQRFYRVRVN